MRNRLMNNEVMSGVNMNGNGGKVAFGKTTIFQLITGTLMNNEVMSGMNMNGNGGKVAFGKTTIFQLITEMALKNHKGTESEVVQICSRLLKYAPDRKGGGGRKENSA
ncbi:Hypothetical predicted protein [Paramuricea clavata]|uniref:Uncharacterized protein n=1 Tax=Paramuricea clavata TaxID=317549 RepID=A0A7D9L9L7_PARCT|nr:Hypothetical predicted protein [Paramuricea clavata]